MQLAYLMAALFGKVAVYTPSLYAGDQKFLIGADYKGGAEAAQRDGSPAGDADDDQLIAAHVVSPAVEGAARADALTAVRSA